MCVLCRPQLKLFVFPVSCSFTQMPLGLLGNGGLPGCARLRVLLPFEQSSVAQPLYTCCTQFCISLGGAV